ncbi:MAG: lysophospholipid acyltransferase family protein [Gemmatimonadota bacterium]
MAKLARAILRLFGWKVRAHLPRSRRYVLIGAPHTSNWDFPVALLALRALNIPGRWVGKHTLFRWPLGPIMRRLGGVPVDRRSSHRFVEQIVERFRENEELVIVISPEGTRRRTPYWRTGFYYIARNAGVPIALGYLDYGRKEAGVDGVVVPSGDLERDLEAFRRFYADKTGKRPEKTGRIRLRSPAQNVTARSGSAGRPADSAAHSHEKRL